MPDFSEDLDIYSPVTIPSEEDFGDFANNVAYAGFALWDDSENTDLQDWVENFDWAAVDFPEPTGEVFGGGIGFIEVPQSEDIYVACFYMEEVDEVVWCAYADGNLETSTGSFDPADMPEEAGPTDAGF
jgi:hypothetical protein